MHKKGWNLPESAAVLLSLSSAAGGASLDFASAGAAAAASEEAAATAGALVSEVSGAFCSMGAATSSDMMMGSDNGRDNLKVGNGMRWRCVLMMKSWWLLATGKDVAWMWSRDFGFDARRSQDAN